MTLFVQKLEMHVTFYLIWNTNRNETKVMLLDKFLKGIVAGPRCSVWVSCAQQGIMYWVSCARDVLGVRRKGIKTIVVIELNL